MKIDEKLDLLNQYQGILLFREGLFLRAYNQSAYILNEILGQQLKLKFYQAAGARNQWIVKCGFPANKINERLPGAALTSFGYRIAGDFDLTDYGQWFGRRCLEENEMNEMAKADSESLLTTSRRRRSSRCI
ncbi:hypothetical protein A9G09_04345 [Gilliamella sp. wkB292]|uniref:hypothetical protein n=1 Tax=Gilliamella sp. wkB292 TaxID=3120262 RepID=UPI00080E51D0|nr:hypothetical protein [Gilliamella apicola]OCG15585.1 hypothetical protein A9G09_04345 [Gilliamella apicola]